MQRHDSHLINKMFRSGFNAFNQVQNQGGPKDSNTEIYLTGIESLNPGRLDLRGGFKTTSKHFDYLKQ
jgi:hypothetical protein